MAEDEIRKHTKAAYNTLLNKEKTWQHKLKDILVEIVIIVFAVSVSIWFHNLSEKWQEQSEEKTFLNELVEDLRSDTANLQSSLRFYNFSLNGMKYFSRVGAGDTLSNDSLNKYSSLFFSNTELDAHISHYEALKGSGKYDIIENKQILNDIIELHESNFLHITTLNNYYTQFIERVASFIEQNAQLNAQGKFTNGQQLLYNSQMRLLLGYGRNNLQFNIIPAHENGINKCNELSRKLTDFIHSN